MTFTSCVLLGDVMIDRSFHGTVSRMSPEEPTIPIVLQTHAVDALGGAGNLLLNIVSVMDDIPLTLLCKLGPREDDDTQKVLKMLPSTVQCENVVYLPHIPTIVKTRIFVHGRMVSRFDLEVPNQLEQSLDRVTLDKSTLVVISDYGGMCLGSYYHQFMQRAYKAHACIVVDPKQDSIYAYEYATVIKPNLRELLQFGRSPDLVAEAVQRFMLMSNDELVRALSSECRDILAKTYIKYVIVTLEHRGLFLFSNAIGATYWPQSTVKVVDVVGAGDTTLAVILSLIRSHGNVDILHTDPINVLKRAGRGGQSAVQFSGNFHLTKTLLSFIDRDLPSHKLIMCTQQDFQWDRDLVTSFASSVKARGKTLVASNGCFDMCHAGHLRALIEGQMQGNIHVVAINSDASVRALKGNTRPINSIVERVRVLCALPFVDFVVVFNESSPLKLYSHLRPSVIVKGAEYQKKGTIVPGAEYADRVHFVELLEGVSTTSTVAKILQRPDMRPSCTSQLD